MNDWTLPQLKRHLLDGADPATLLRDHGDALSPDCRAWLEDHLAVTQDLENMALSAQLASLDDVSQDEVLGKPPKRRIRPAVLSLAAAVVIFALLAIWQATSPNFIELGDHLTIGNNEPIHVTLGAQELAHFRIQDGSRPISLTVQDDSGKVLQSITLGEDENDLYLYTDATEGEQRTLIADGPIVLDFKNKEIIGVVDLEKRIEETFAQARDKDKDIGEREAFAIMGLTLARASNINDQWPIAANLAGYIHLERGQVHKSKRFLDEAMFLLSDGQNLELFATVNYNQGHLLLKKGKLQDALVKLIKAEDIYNKLGLQEDVARTLNVMGGAFDLSDSHELALDCYTRAWDLIDADAYHLQALLLNNMGAAYNSLGDPEVGLYYLEKALETWLQLDDPEGIGLTYSNLAWTYRLLGQPDKEMEQYRLAKNLETVPDRTKALAQMNEGMALANQGRFEESAALLNQGKEYFDKTGDTYLSAYTRLYEGTALQLELKPREALDVLNQAVELARSGDHQLLIPIQTLRAKVLAELGNLPDAIALARECVDLVDKQGQKTQDASLRSLYRAGKFDSYSLLIHLLMERNQQLPEKDYDIQALEVAERATGRVLLETLNQAYNTKISFARPDQERRLDGIIEDMQTVQRKLDRLPNTVANVDQISRLEQDFALLDRSRARIQKEISEQEAHFEKPEPAQTLKRSGMAALGKDDHTVLVKFHLGEEESYVWTVDGEDIQAFVLPPAEEINAIAEDTLAALAAGKQDSQTRDSLKRLGDLLYPSISTIDAGKRLAIAADGSLQSLPLGAATFLQAPLLNRHEIIYLPSFSVLATLRESQKNAWPLGPKRMRALFMADPVFEGADPRLPFPAQLPTPTQEVAELQIPRKRSGEDSLLRLVGTGKEVDALAPLFELQPSVRLGFDANRDWLLNQDLHPFQVLHLATHGKADTRFPERSRIELSRFNEQGEFLPESSLRLHDIYGLDLKAELVVLSACQTGLGRDIKGEGVIGLSRAFMYAGSQRVVASLWQIPDELTAELMKRFYTEMLEEGRKPAEALRLAQFSMLQDSRWKNTTHPWAFTITGDWR